MTICPMWKTFFIQDIIRQGQTQCKIHKIGLYIKLDWACAGVMSGAQSAHLVNLLLDGAQTSPANLCADSTSCCWIVRRLLRLVAGARLVDTPMLSVLFLELGKLGTVVLDGQGK